MISIVEIRKARETIKKYVHKTKVIEIDQNIYLKLENKQPVVKGFKVRGAANAILSSKSNGVMTAALGTHGFAVGYLGKKLGIKTICMMISNPPRSSERKMKRLVDEILYGERDFSETERLAIQYAKKNNIQFIHPYNNAKVIAGQGTVGLELLEQIPKLSAIYVPIGGGGLISGISIAVKSINPKIKIIGVQPENMHAMVSSVRTKRIVIMKPKKSIAEKLAMNLNPKTITFRIISKYVDYFVLVPENEIALAMKRIFLKTGNIVEGAGAIAYAASLRDKKRKGRVACIVSGGNINRDFFRKLINEAK